MQRREFLELIAATSAAVASSAMISDSAGAARLNRQKIKVGQIGTKHAHALGQFDTLKKLNDLYEVVGIVEPDSARREQMQKTARFVGVPWMTEEQLLNASGLQAVAVETEVRDLLTTAQTCVDAGLHVHVDKPAGNSMPALEKLHQTAKQKSLSIQMGYMFRYNPAFRFLFEWVRQGHLGQVFEVHGVMSKTVDDATRRELAEFKGGSMFELGCHLIDPLLHLLGKPQNVTGFLRNTRPEKDNLADNTLAVFEYPKATATIRSSVVEVDGGRRRQFVVCGDQGTIAIRPLEPPVLELTLPADRGGQPKGTHLVQLPSSPGRYHGAWVDFAKVINGEKEHEFTHEHDLSVQQSLMTICNS